MHEEKNRNISTISLMYGIAKGNHDLYQPFRSVFLQFFNLNQ